MPTRSASIVALAAFVVASRALCADVPPTDAGRLFEWLAAGVYKAWAGETTPHPSAGPHLVAVRTYLNPALDRSLAAGNEAHPAGAAAVKELFGGDGRLAGWAVSVKTRAASDGGKGWYWYEVMSTRPGSRPVAAANGAALCFGCHAPGRDFVLIPHPLK